ncbi:MAG: hypothetical protein H0W87_01225 [Actinobacteria bacterium]|nr:hypothetical protein [Actinomycetota bacterium]
MPTVLAAAETDAMTWTERDVCPYSEGARRPVVATGRFDDLYAIVNVLDAEHAPVKAVRRNEERGLQVRVLPPLLDEGPAEAGFLFSGQATNTQLSTAFKALMPLGQDLEHVPVGFGHNVEHTPDNAIGTRSRKRSDIELTKMTRGRRQ